MACQLGQGRRRHPEAGGESQADATSLIGRGAAGLVKSVVVPPPRTSATCPDGAMGSLTLSHLGPRGPGSRPLLPPGLLGPRETQSRRVLHSLELFLASGRVRAGLVRRPRPRAVAGRGSPRLRHRGPRRLASALRRVASSSRRVASTLRWLARSPCLDDGKWK